MSSTSKLRIPIFIPTLAIIVLCAVTASAQGIPPPQPPMPPMPVEPPVRMPHPVIQRDLTLTDMRVDIDIDGAVAKTTIRQTLRNDGNFVAEGKYMLPLPKGASVSDFKLIDGDTVLTPEILPADEARRIYQEIVRTMRDPGLLEYQDSRTFSVSVFPFQPGQSRQVEVSFTQALGGTTDLVQYHLPLRWAGWSRCINTNFVLTYNIDSNYDLGTISSPTHGVSAHRDGNRRASGSYEATVDDFGTDFTLNIGRRTGDFAASLMCFPGEGGEDGYFLLSLLAAMPQNEKYVPKDMLFIFDKSGSMSGEKIEQAKGALKFVIGKLKPDDRFNLVYYSDSVDQLKDGLVKATGENIREARDFVSRLEADGGTDINTALQTGGRMLDPDGRPTYVIFLTDGLPTVGDTDIDHIIANAKDKFDSKVKLFVFGVGYDVNTTLLDSLSYNHHGTVEYVSPDEDIEVAVSQFYARMSSPALIDIAVEFSGFEAYDLMPRDLPDLFHNSEMFITGRYRRHRGGDIGVVVMGDNENGRQKMSISIDANVSSANHTVPRLWATRKVSYLLDQLRLHGDNKELLGEVDRLAMRYGIVTPYTSYLITEPDAYFDMDDRQADFAMAMDEARKDESGEMAVGRSKMNQANQSASKAAAPQQAGAAAGGARGYGDSYMSGIQGLDSRIGDLEGAVKGSADPNSTVNYVNNQTFVLQSAEEGTFQWVDARMVADEMDLVRITTYGDQYFELLSDYPELADYLSQGEQVVLVLSDDLALETTLEEAEASSTEISKVRKALDKGGYIAQHEGNPGLLGAFKGGGDNGGTPAGWVVGVAAVVIGASTLAVLKLGEQRRRKGGLNTVA